MYEKTFITNKSPTAIIIYIANSIKNISVELCDQTFFIAMKGLADDYIRRKKKQTKQNRHEMARKKDQCYC